ncbi:MAG: TVP38/TMEM64 family protein [Pseudarcicella sp.]|nr:TVP38/TMEM64 family protein [Pseudarcicella sp.]MBP6410389.1 TVP38/TMEM64 family protein [Pseudarcicella sp.]
MLKFLQTNKSTFFYTLYISIVPLVCSSYILHWISNNETVIQNFSTAEWCALFFLTVLTMGLSLTPTTFIAILSGYFLGFVSIIPVSVCYLIASVISYYLVRFINNGTLLNHINANEKSKEMFEALKKEEFKIIFFSRISPIFPFAVTNLILSLSNVSIRNFIIAGFWGMLPRTMLSVLAGSKGKELKSIIDSPLSSNWQEWLVALLVIISFLGLGYVFKRLKLSYNTLND